MTKPLNYINGEPVELTAKELAEYNAKLDAGRFADCIKGVKLDLELAREKAREIIRANRKQALQDLDIAFNIKLDNGEDTASISEKRNLLRAAPEDSRIEKARAASDFEVIIEEYASVQA